MIMHRGFENNGALVFKGDIQRQIQDEAEAIAELARTLGMHKANLFTLCVSFGYAELQVGPDTVARFYPTREAMLFIRK